MNRSAELQLGAARRAPNAPTWRSSLQARGSWSQCVRNGEWGLSMNRAPSPHPSPPLGERVSEGRVRGSPSVHGPNAPQI